MTVGAATTSLVRLRLRPWLASGPASLAYAALAVVVAVWAQTTWVGPVSARTQHLTSSVANLADGRWWTLATSLVTTRHLPGLVAGCLALLTVGIWSERKLGSLRFLLIGAACHVIGSLSAIAACELLIGTSWGHGLRSQFTAGFVPFLVGAGTAATGLLGTLWRRRWRTGLAVTALTLAGFSGRIADIAHLAAFAAGLIIGQILFHRSRPERKLIGTAHEGRNLVSITVLSLVSASALAALRPTGAGPLAPLRLLFRPIVTSWENVNTICDTQESSRACRSAMYSQFSAGWAPGVTLIAFVVLLIVFALALRKGWRAAWVGALAMCGALAVLSVVHFVLALSDFERFVVHGRTLTNIIRRPGYQDYLGIAMPLVMVALLWFTRSFFTRALPTGYVRRVWTIIGVTVGTVALMRFAASMILAEAYDPAATPALIAADLPGALLPPSMASFLPPVLFPLSDVAQLWRDVPTAFMWCGITALVIWMFVRKRPVDEEVAAVRARAQNPGGGHLSWITTWPGNSHWITDSAAVAYRPAAGVALTASDPVCAAADVGAAVRDFAAYASEAGLMPAFYSVSADTAQAAAALDFTVIKIGEEAVLDLPGLEFKGKAFQDIRTAMNRAGREGIEVVSYTWPNMPLGLREQIHAISEHWVSERGLPEMGFTLGAFTELADPKVDIMVALDGERTVHGAISLLPVYRAGQLVGRTLDFMRRAEDGFRPVMELLIGTAALRARDAGLEFMSLASSPLVSTGEPAAESTAIDDLLAGFAHRLEPLYGFKSLLAFKSKFGPRFEPVYLAVPEVTALGQVAAAIGAAHFPTLSPMRLGWSLVFSG